MLPQQQPRSFAYPETYQQQLYQQQLYQQQSQASSQTGALVALTLTTLLLVYGVYWYDAAVVLVAFLVFLPIVLLATLPSDPQPGAIYYYTPRAPVPYALPVAPGAPPT
jgi:hypothetical protein